MRIAVAVVCLLCTVRSADAFCGFYVAGSSDPLLNDATQVVLMRKGTRTVLSMQNNYKGPPGAFAMVVPVPVVLREQDVKTLTRDVFRHVEQMGAPRLVEYWEQDPCIPDIDLMGMDPSQSADGLATSVEDRASAGLGVTIEAQFTVGEYQIVILSAKDSTGLDTWLRREKYNIPAAAEPLLRPYVEANMKFFIAKVDPAKVKFEGDRAVLSPLRFHYDADDFALPIRLGLANSGGTQDLIVSILAAERYEVANYPNVTIPTNLDVKPAVKDSFAAFYAALFDATLEKHKGAVVTEYAWQASSCDPCPGPQLDGADFMTLGADVLVGARDKPERYAQQDFVLTRLHARYGKEIKDDLVFKQAPPIVGGREIHQTAGPLEQAAAPSTMNSFQGRYAIRHPWTGPIRCLDAKRNRWGEPPMELQKQPGFQQPIAKAALDLGAAPRGTLQLASVVVRGVPELGLSIPGGPSDPPAVAINTGSGSAVAAPVAQKKAAGCGCRTTSVGGVLWPGLLALAGITRRRSRRR